METIPLFPLSTVLVPHGRLALQIFEPRYVDLVSRCLKENTGFGVIWLREGSEVYRPESEYEPRLSQLGTYAHIVDWDSLPNGLLGITIEGLKKFRLLSSQQRADHLHMAEVEWIDEEPYIPLLKHSEAEHSEAGYSGEMHALLLQLLEHPHIERMKINPVVEDVARLGCLLTQLLPIAESVKFELLMEVDPMSRIHRLIDILDQLGQ